MSHHVLLLGGHGKVAQLLTTLLLQRAWKVTSVIRNPDQVTTIKALAPSATASNLNVLVRSIEDIGTSQPQAQALIDEVRPDYIVWSAGAGGKGGPSRTYAIDRDAAISFIRAAAATPSVTRFLLVSHLSSRRQAPSWWDAAGWEDAQKVNKTLATYYDAKLPADEALYRAGKARPDFAAIDLRPGALTLEPAGPVELGRTKGPSGTISRTSVARVADALLAHPDTKSTWVDLLDGTEEVDAAVDRVVREKVDVVEGEPVTKE